MKSVGEERLLSPYPVASFYERAELLPMWDAENAAAMLRLLQASAAEGLVPDEYHLALLQELTEISPEEEVLLTDASLTLADHLVRGRVHPESLIADWCIPPRRFDLPLLLQAALEGHYVEKMMSTLVPRHAAYVALRNALAEYRAMPDWPSVTPGPALKPGMTGPRVAELRRRLGLAEGDAYDEELRQLVVAFQQRHGIPADGVAGPGTVADLNVTREQRISQLVLNMERWRWMPAALPERYILVNIAAFELMAVRQGEPPLTLRTVVGAHYAKTPFLRSEVESVVINPSWYVPPSIARRELFPKQQADPGYFKRNHYDVIAGNRIRQSPGPWNALGRLKFHMPNPYAVYLHDTPSRALFSSDARAASHGCIRVQDPVRLAEWVLGSEYDRETIEKQIAKKQTRTLKVNDPVRVYLLYWTAFVDADGVVQFRRDVYDRDRELAAALR